MATQQKKTGFVRSTISGVVGFFKGALAGGAVGAAMGAVLGAGIAVLSGGLAPAVIAASATTYAVATAAITATLGSFSGMMTEVVKSRESTQLSTDDVVNAVKVAYAQGIEVGHTMEKEKGTYHQDRLAKERASAAITAQSHQIH